MTQVSTSTTLGKDTCKNIEGNRTTDDSQPMTLVAEAPHAKGRAHGHASMSYTAIVPR
jgi:hypothetical protein